MGVFIVLAGGKASNPVCPERKTTFRKALARAAIGDLWV